MTTSLTDTALSFERRGSGSPIVLVHGLGSRWQVFAPVLDALAEHHEVIAVDLPGFGASPEVPGVEPGPRGYARWLAGWFEEQGIERPHVVGNSMGGGIALELGRLGVASRVTAFSPIGFYGTPGLLWTKTLLTGLRLAGTYARPVIDAAAGHPIGRTVLFANMFGKPAQVDPQEARDDVAGLVGATAFRAARDSFGGFRLKDEDLKALEDVPVTIAWGTRDVVLVHRTQSALARQVMPFARHVDLPGCGHLPFSDDPELCAQLVLEEAR